MEKIGIITHTHRVIDLAREVSRETGHELIVRMGIPNKKALEKAHRLAEENGVSAVIAPGAIYEQIYNQLAVPVVRLELTNFELLKALNLAVKLGKKIVYVDFRRATTKRYDPELVKSTCNFDIDRITMYDVSEVDRTADLILRREYDVVMSAVGCILDRVSPHLHTVELSYSKSDLLEAVLQAAQASEIGRREKEKLHWMRTVVESFQEGMLTLDRTGKVETFNAAAAEITGMKAEDLVGKKIDGLLPNETIRSLYGDGKGTTDEMVSLDSGKTVVNRIPIFIGSEKRGLVIKLQKVTRIQELEQEIRKGLFHKGFIARARFRDIAGDSSLMRDLRKTAQKYAVSCSNILITGETGTGKELFAQSIHNASAFAKGPFVAVNCAALSESLLESELFGYEEGAFTGARKGGKAGLFELAHNGTIFLDEIGDMPLSLQSRLLRVVQEKEVIRLGGSRIIPVHNRIICATNKDLAREVEKGSFRKDLYFRINILQIHIPPLSEHPADIPCLGRIIIERKCRETRRKIVIAPDLFPLLASYTWPGNGREIEAFMERLLALTEKAEVSRTDFLKCLNHFKGHPELLLEREPSGSLSLLRKGKILVSPGTLAEIESEIIKHVLNQTGGDRDRAERILGISKTTLWRRMKKDAEEKEEISKAKWVKMG